jgi:hypothetical protein
LLKIAKESLSLETPIGDEEDSHLGAAHRESGHTIAAAMASVAGVREGAAAKPSFRVHRFALTCELGPIIKWFLKSRYYDT